MDDLVLVRNDGTPAYNLAVVVDDGLQGVDQVVRARDLWSSAPRQAQLAELLGFIPPVYAHTGLVTGPGGVRLSKSAGAAGLSDLADSGIDTARSWRGSAVPSDSLKLLIPMSSSTMWP